MITITEIAKIAGTSTTAVSLVLNGKDDKRVSPEKQKLILDIAERFHYRKRSAARALKMQRTFRVAICMQGTFAQYPAHSYYSHYSIISQVSNLLQKQGYGITIVQNDINDSISDMAQALQNEESDGYLFVNWQQDVLSKLAFSFLHDDRPVIAIGTPLESDFSSAVIDREQSFYNGTRYLLEKGYSEICILDLDTLRHLLTPKYEGYTRAIREAGLRNYTPVSCKTPNTRSVMSAVRELIRRYPQVEAVMLTDNLFAPVIQEELMNHSIAILGFGDDCFAEMCEPRIPYLRLPINEMSVFCVQEILALMEKRSDAPTQRSFECSLCDPATGSEEFSFPKPESGKNTPLMDSPYPQESIADQ